VIRPSATSTWKCVGDPSASVARLGKVIPGVVMIDSAHSSSSWRAKHALAKARGPPLTFIQRHPKIDVDADLRRHDNEGGKGGSFISSLGISWFFAVTFASICRKVRKQGK
jgi:hypothetical protein